MPQACPSFYDAFKQNMDALGLPAPTSLFGSLQAALTNVGAMLNAFKQVGRGATVGELIGATTAFEQLAVVAALSASAYVGACIGSLIVAADAAMVCTGGVQAGKNVQRWSADNGLRLPAGMVSFIERHPEVMMDAPGRRNYAFLASRRTGAVT